VKKIPTIFERDWDGDRSRVTRDLHPGCEWVVDGTPSAATRKYDGTCVMFDGTDWFARREVKEGKEPPDGFVEIDHDEETGKTFGWEPIAQSPFAKFFREAHAARLDLYPWEIGTYELCGPKIQGNPEHFDSHRLILHAQAERAQKFDRSYDGLLEFFEQTPWEGIVFHHEDGRMAKIKRRDFGLKR